MSRIVYFYFSNTGRPTGGHKVLVRHVEALTELGYDAVVLMPSGATPPAWFPHTIPFQVGGDLRDDDILVLPEDATDVLRRIAPLPYRKVVFCQNHFYAGVLGVGLLEPQQAAAYGEYMACSPTSAAWIARYLPHQAITVVPAFADERRFRPAAQKRALIACTPRKRPTEARAIRFMFDRLYKGKLDWRWSILQDAAEDDVARAFSEAALFLSLSRLEGLGMTTLEAMASGCVVAGFTGIGGRDYASAANGFWVDEDDCEAAATALVRAADLVEQSGAGHGLMRKASRDTASFWSHAAFVKALDGFWSSRAPRQPAVSQADPA